MNTIKGVIEVINFDAVGECVWICYFFIKVLFIILVEGLLQPLVPFANCWYWEFPDKKLNNA